MWDRDYLAQLSADPNFQALLASIEVPTVPEWTKDRTEQDWAYQTGMKRGAELVLIKLGKQIKED